MFSYFFFPTEEKKKIRGGVDFSFLMQVFLIFTWYLLQIWFPRQDIYSADLELISSSLKLKQIL